MIQTCNTISVSIIIWAIINSVHANSSSLKSISLLTSNALTSFRIKDSTSYSFSRSTLLITSKLYIVKVISKITCLALSLTCSKNCTVGCRYNRITNNWNGCSDCCTRCTYTTSYSCIFISDTVLNWIITLSIRTNSVSRWTS